MTNIELAIRAIIVEEVAAAEKRITESLSLASGKDLTFKEACDYLQMSSYSLRRLCVTKKIPHRTVGAEGSKNPRYLFNSVSLDKWKREEEERNYIPS